MARQRRGGSQDRVSGVLLERSHRVIDGVDIYDFDVSKLVWIGGACASVLLALTLWNAERPTPGSRRDEAAPDA